MEVTGPAAEVTESATEVTEPATEEEEDNEEEEIFDDIFEFGKVDDDDSSESEEVINFAPLDKKPTIRFEQSSMASRLSGFLADMERANQQLDEDIRSGKVSDYNLEIEDDAEEYIQMELGLGVLEEHVEGAEEEEDDDDDVITEKKVLIEEI